MSKNSTLKLWDFLLKEEYLNFDRSEHKIFSEKQIEPKKETINNILAYASSVRGFKIQSNNKALIFLN